MADSVPVSTVGRQASDAATVQGVANAQYQVDTSAAAWAGLTPDYQGFRNSWFGQPHPVQLDMIYKIYREDPQAFGITNIIVNDIVSDGWTLVKTKTSKVGAKDVVNESEVDENDPDIKYVREVLERSNFDAGLYDLTNQFVVYGNMYFEAIREGSPAARDATVRPDFKASALPSMDEDEAVDLFVKEISKVDIKPEDVELKKKDGSIELILSNFTRELEKATRQDGRLVRLFPLDAKTIQIDYDEHGNVLKYVQRVLHRRVEFYPDDLIHLAIGRVGNRPYGMSGFTPLVKQYMVKFQAEKYTFDFFRRAFMPRLIYVLKNLDDASRNKFIANLKAVTAHEDIVVNGEVDVKETTQTHSDMQFIELLKYIKQHIYIALQVPPIVAGDMMMGSAGGSKGTSQSLFEGTYYKRIKSLKKQISDELNRTLFTKRNFGTDSVRFVFLEDNTKESQRRTQNAQLMSTIPYVTPNEIRQMVNLPPMENGDGDRYIYEITQENAEKVALNAGGVKGGQAKQQGQFPGGVDSRSSIERRENAEDNNTSAQMESKKAFDPNFATRDAVNPNASDEAPRRDYGYGAMKDEVTPTMVTLSQVSAGQAYDRMKEIVDNPVENAGGMNSDRQWGPDVPPLKQVLEEGKKRRPTNFALSAKKVDKVGVSGTAKTK